MNTVINQIFGNVAKSVAAVKLANSSRSGKTLRGNLHIVGSTDKISVRYYDTEIINIDAAKGTLTIYLGGYATPSTYNHINNSLYALGLAHKINQAKGNTLLDGKEFNSYEKQVINLN